MKREDVTVLVTGAGGVTAVSVLRALRAGDGPVRIVAADCARLAAGHAFADTTRRIPRADDVDFVDAILDACVSEDVSLLIPTINAELPVLARARERLLRRGVFVVVAESGCVDTFDDKLATHEFLCKHGFPNPATAELYDDDLPSTPLMLKPRRGCGSRGVLRLDDARDVAWARSRFDRSYLVQEFVEGVEHTVDVFADFNGEIRSTVARRRDVIKAGVSYVGCTVTEPDVTRQAAEIARAAGLVGPANLQCIRGPRGLCWTEGNARFSGGLSLTVHAGVNAPAALVEWARCGALPEFRQARSGVTMLRHWTETYVEA